MADLFKACADVLIPLHTPTPHQHSHTLKNPLSSNSLLTPQPKQSTQVISLITRALTHSLNWYLWYLISSAVPLSFSLLVCLSAFWSWEGPVPVSAVLWHRARSDFWMNLAWKWVCNFPILHCALVAVHFQIGSQRQEAWAKTLSMWFWVTHLGQNRKYTLYREIAKRFSKVSGGTLRLWPLFRAISHVLIKIMATQLELHLKLRGAQWTMNGLNHHKGYNPRLLSISKNHHRSSENNPIWD